MHEKSTTGARARSDLRQDIEGLRAVAVGVVVAFHVGVPSLGGGYAGVDIFFVISGFLITSLLLREIARRERVSLLAFYARRARRLLPAASLVLLVTAVLGWVVLPATNHANLGADVLAATLYVINWTLAARSVDYLAEDAAVSPLQHYWSLAVEEQFYVLWPLLIVGCLALARRARVRPRRAAFLGMLFVTLASLGWSIHLTGTDPAAYFVSTTRFWELGIGALLAFLPGRLERLPRALATPLAALGLLLIIASTVHYSTTTQWPGWRALVPTLGVAMIIAAGSISDRTVVARVLSARPLPWIGGLSYATYLWHWPLIVLSQQAWPEIRVRHLVVVAAFSVLLAWLTKHLVEDPIRFATGLSARPWLSLRLAALLMTATAGGALVLVATVPSLVPGTQATGARALAADAAASTWTKRTDPTAAFTRTGPVQPPPEIATEDTPGYYADDCQVPRGQAHIRPDCTYGQADSQTVVAVLGDSKTGQWFEAIALLAEIEGWRIDLYLKSACPFTVDGDNDEDCNQFGRRTLAALTGDRAPDFAVVSSGDVAEPALVAGMSRALDALDASGVQVVAIGNNAHPGFNAYECAYENQDDYLACGFQFPPSPTWAIDEAAEAADIDVITMNDWICPPKHDICPVVIGETLIYRQGSHLTDSYVRTLSPLLHRELARLGWTTVPSSRVDAALSSGS